MPPDVYKRQIMPLASTLTPHAAIAEKEHTTRVFKGLLRSEEHTSELQSPLIISYAVFCLKKKLVESRIRREV